MSPEIRSEHAANIAATTFVVTASSYEQQALWSAWHDQRGVPWEQNSMGLMREIGKVAGRPICVCVFWVKIGQQLVAFVDGTSQLVDHKMIEEWIKTTFPRARENNAQNFHNTLHDIERADGKTYGREERRR